MIFNLLIFALFEISYSLTLLLAIAATGKRCAPKVGDGLDDPPVTILSRLQTRRSISRSDTDYQLGVEGRAGFASVSGERTPDYASQGARVKSGRKNRASRRFPYEEDAAVLEMLQYLLEDSAFVCHRPQLFALDPSSQVHASLRFIMMYLMINHIVVLDYVVVIAIIITLPCFIIIIFCTMDHML